MILISAHGKLELFGGLIALAVVSSIYVYHRAKKRYRKYIERQTKKAIDIMKQQAN